MNKKNGPRREKNGREEEKVLGRTMGREERRVDDDEEEEEGDSSERRDVTRGPFEAVFARFFPFLSYVFSS